MYADDVIQFLWLTVSARGSSEVSTDFARQKDGPPQYQVVRETNGKPVLKVWLSLFRTTKLTKIGTPQKYPLEKSASGAPES